MKRLIVAVLGCFAIAAAAAGCSAGPDTQTRDLGTGEAESRPAEELGPGEGANGRTSTIGDATGTVVEADADEIEVRDDGVIVLPRWPRAGELATLPLAEDGFEGSYFATTDHVRTKPYALLINRNEGRLEWLLLADPMAETPAILGRGVLDRRAGGLEFVEREPTTDGLMRDVAVQHFPAQRSKNRWTILPAVETPGGGDTTAMGDVMSELGEEVHWVRVTGLVDGDSAVPATAPVFGRFNPSITPDGNRLLRPDPAQLLTIWPDGEWRFIVPADDPFGRKPGVYGGTWVQRDQTLTFTQTIPAVIDGERAPQETFAFAYQPTWQVLWLSKAQTDVDQPTAILPLASADDQSVVYVRAQPIGSESPGADG
jgi:hypothetical protein